MGQKQPTFYIVLLMYYLLNRILNPLTQILSFKLFGHDIFYPNTHQHASQRVLFQIELFSFDTPAGVF